MVLTQSLAHEYLLLVVSLFSLLLFVLTSFFFFFFNDTATTEIYTLSPHDALPIYRRSDKLADVSDHAFAPWHFLYFFPDPQRSEEHTSELQSQSNLVCRLLLEKKKKKRNPRPTDKIIL